ncbi:Eukaryotic translation initiation factor 3 subunit H [Schistosoma japonicum]|nr:Eukaryotic translation initiation factor 3 subunit H [Schistosoma japonicum]
MDYQSKISKPIDTVQVEGKVFLKMIKHYEEESVSSQNFVNGVLLGLAQGSRLEITNCFPLPKTQDDDPNANDALITYEANMIRNLRQLQTDYLNVGFYQAGPGGVSINRANIENIYQRQSNLPESVLLTYDPTRTSRGQIGLKAYRLSDDVLAARSEAEDRFRLTGHKEAASSVGRSSFTRVLEEIPVVIHNSHLVNILLTEIVDNQELSRSELSTNSSMLDLAPPLPKDHPGRYSTLNLSMASSLEQQLRSLLAGLETVHDYQYLYQRSLSKSQTAVTGKTATETRNRELAPIRLDTALVSAQLDFYCNSLAQMAGQTMGKLMLTQAVQKTSSSVTSKS